MLSSFLVCTMVVMAGAVAVTKPAMPRAYDVFRSLPKRVGSTEDHEHHVPCEPPPYFTFDEVDMLTSVEEGSLLLEYLNFEGAYDDISKKYAAKIFEDFFNGTEYSFKVIEDYKKGVRYEIYTGGDEVVCIAIEVEGKGFPEQYFIPYSAKYEGEAVIGDRDLVTDSWLETSLGVHTVKTVTHGDCVPVSIERRFFDPETDQQTEFLDNRLFNFELGICDRDKYFKVPEECQQGNALKEPTEEMQKHIQKLRRFRKL
ncbi:uncharacterized protein LOC119738117 [Patiria miniata]|uniref:Uncharacterized protein n=1 Tax=Patiria miniata TaxID=46514 RepID=A0A914AXC2_PATMI|nr:uncharacterized protein LOC119738117 [Patiria miniata]